MCCVCTGARTYTHSHPCCSPPMPHPKSSRFFTSSPVLYPFPSRRPLCASQGRHVRRGCRCPALFDCLGLLRCAADNSGTLAAQTRSKQPLAPYGLLAQPACRVNGNSARAETNGHKRSQPCHKRSQTGHKPSQMVGTVSELVPAKVGAIPRMMRCSERPHGCHGTSVFGSPRPGTVARTPALRGHAGPRVPRGRPAPAAGAVPQAAGGPPPAEHGGQRGHLHAPAQLLLP